MSLEITYPNVKAAVEDRADIVSSSTGRHTTDRMKRRINQSIRRWLDLCTPFGMPAYTKREDGTTDPSATKDLNGWAPREFIDEPGGANQMRDVLQIDIFDGDSAFSMLPLSWAERNIFREPGVDALAVTNGVGFPVFYSVQQGGFSQASKKVIRIFPFADAAYDYTVWYLEDHADFDDAQTGPIDFVHATCFEWVINDAALQCLMSDGTPNRAAYDRLAAEQPRLERDFKFELARRSHIGGRAQDTRGLRLRMLRWAQSGFRGVP